MRLKAAFPENVVLKKLRRLDLAKIHFKVRHLVAFLRGHELNELHLTNDIVRVEGTDNMADVRTICKAVASVPRHVLRSVETLGVVGNPGDKYLVLDADEDTLVPIVKLAVKDKMGLEGPGRRVVDLSEDWSVVREYEVGIESEVDTGA